MPGKLPTLMNEKRLMRKYRRGALFLLPGLFLSTGCLYHAREASDETVNAMVARPYDQLPDQLREKSGTPVNSEQSQVGKSAPARAPVNSTVPMDVQTVAYMQAAQDGKQPPARQFELHVPDAIPGSEVPPMNLPLDPAQKATALNKLYPPLPTLEPEVRPLPGPDGKPYTLSDFQRIAAENSPTLFQAATDVQAALGNLRQTRTYQNPTVSLQEQASNNNSTGGAFGFTFDQVVSTGGKMKLQAAAAQKAVDNAELALKRARSDLATQVRNAYYALLVAKETMRVTRALSVLTDEVYRVQLAYTLNAGLSAGYEPAALRAQAWSARLAYVQSRSTYVYAWKLLLSVINERQLPLSEVAGRIDAFVPYYEYDKVLAHVLTFHTDTQIARNGIDVQNYNLKVNQIMPYYPNLDFNIGMFKDRALLPYGTYATFGVSAPIPVWDQNRGNILAAEAALSRALEEPHRVEMALTNSLATNYTNYRTNLDAVEYYRRYVLPDQVMAYRGTLQRRQIDANAQFGDLVAAQQALATSVTTYLGLLGSLWTSVISVADMLQTDDLFQTAEARGLPALPDLESLPPLPCCHPFGENRTRHGPTIAPAQNPIAPMLPPSPPLSSMIPSVPPSMGPIPTMPASMGPVPSMGPAYTMSASTTPNPAVPTVGPGYPMPASMTPNPAMPTVVPAYPMPASTAPTSPVPATSPPPEEQWHQGPGLVPGLMIIPGLLPAGR